MAKEFELILELDHAREWRGVVMAPVYFQIGAMAFPERGWIDFASVLMGNWITVLLRLSKAGKRGRLLFMEGDFEIRLAKVDQDHLEIKLWEKGENVSGDENIIVELQDLLGMVKTHNFRAQEWLRREGPI